MHEVDAITKLTAQVEALIKMMAQVYQVISLRSGKEYEGPTAKQQVVKEKHDQQAQAEVDKKQAEEQKLYINNPFVEALEKIPTYLKFMKDILAKKRKIEEYKMVALTEECSAILQKKLLLKLKDSNSPNIPGSIGSLMETKALCDMGASINLMPLSSFKRLILGEAKPTVVALQMADHSLTHPRDIIEDILVKIGER
ncbi:uncharacterized protein LOC133034375 [Cannabis sativa]|uniref:uncharacterized protein LOC133034375 n=1 Tax=Cannabis sativa TaxID=3483 RepID=UPI0029CA40B7|nr:uncharacterized protein LOC133034375 [Cannabis sativa]